MMGRSGHKMKIDFDGQHCMKYTLLLFVHYLNVFVLCKVVITYHLIYLFCMLMIWVQKKNRKVGKN